MPSKTSISFLGLFCIFGPLVGAQGPTPNPAVRPVYPTLRQPYPVVPPLYQFPKSPSMPGPIRRQTHTDSAHPSTAWTQNVIAQEDRRFDFKTVAKGTKSEHYFEIYNPFEQNLRIESVSSSCTCVTPFLLDDKDELQTYEKTAVVAHFHTEANEGFKTATITVVIDKPQPAEIQLHIQGTIRPDISMTPSEIRFGQVREGQGAERTIEVLYTGGTMNWQIVDFSQNKNLSAEIVEKKPIPRGTSTKIKIKLAADAPQGTLNERFYLLSNDSDRRRELPILVSATIGKVLTITPQTQFLGFLPPGEASTKKITLLRGTQPFKITKIECDDPNVEIGFTPDPDATARGVYHIPVSFKNPQDGSPKLNEENGMLHAVVKIETDDPKQEASFNVTAKIVER